jgi:hypothetical protein
MSESAYSRRAITQKPDTMRVTVKDTNPWGVVQDVYVFETADPDSRMLYEWHMGKVRRAWYALRRRLRKSPSR